MNLEDCCDNQTIRDVGNGANAPDTVAATIPTVLAVRDRHRPDGVPLAESMDPADQERRRRIFCGWPLTVTLS